LKVLHVISSLNFGGTEVTCRDISRAMRCRLNVENEIVALRIDRDEIRYELTHAAGCGVRIAPDPTVSRLKFGIWFFHLCRTLRPDAVLFHLFGVDHLVAALAARLAGVKSIGVKAGNPPPERCREARVWMKWVVIIRLCRVMGIPIIASSRYILSSLGNLARLPQGSRVIHNGCSFEELSIRAEAMRKQRTSDGTIVIGTISRIDPIKDHKTLIRAFGLLTQDPDYLTCRLRIIGDGILRLECEALAGELGVSDLVEFLGSRSDVPEQLGGMDVFAFSTTENEGFGIVLIEALAAGLPIVATDVEACREVLQGGRFGALVPCGDPEAFVAELKRVIAKVPSFSVTKKSHLPFVREMYDIEAAARLYLSVLLNETPAFV
jgi:glycosyltransferase involved in cell wall biosynthesis